MLRWVWGKRSIWSCFGWRAWLIHGGTGDVEVVGDDEAIEVEDKTKEEEKVEERVPSPNER